LIGGIRVDFMRKYAVLEAIAAGRGKAIDNSWILDNGELRQAQVGQMIHIRMDDAAVLAEVRFGAGRVEGAGKGHLGQLALGVGVGFFSALGKDTPQSPDVVLIGALENMVQNGAQRERGARRGVVEVIKSLDLDRLQAREPWGYVGC